MINLDNIVIYIIFCLICVVIYSVKEISEGRRNKSLKERITDIYEERDSDYFNILLYEQKVLNIAPEYMIELSEKEKVVYLIQLFRNDTTDWFLRDTLSNERNLVYLSYRSYFYATFCDYLCSDIFLREYNRKKYDLFGEIISRGKNEGTGSNATYWLSEFGLTYCKLKYIFYEIYNEKCDDIEKVYSKLINITKNNDNKFIKLKNLIGLIENKKIMSNNS